MLGSGPALHYVCTLDEAADLIAAQDSFWVSRCGCRESRGGCARGPHDVCLQFRPETAANLDGLRPISRAEAEEILREAGRIPLVTRPFRGREDRTLTEGICFCCDDCGRCVETCRFGARSLGRSRLELTREDCHGCGLCVSVCPSGCIEMAERP